MLRYVSAALAFSGALMLGASLGASSPVASAHADALQGVTGPSAQSQSELPPPPDDPKKKKAGEECKNSGECQKHHKCAKADEKDEKGVCQAPPRRLLPPGAVT